MDPLVYFVQCNLCIDYTSDIVLAFLLRRLNIMVSYVTGNVHTSKIRLKAKPKSETLSPDELEDYESNKIAELNHKEHPTRKEIDKVLETYGLELEFVTKGCFLLAFRVKPGATANIFLGKYASGDIADIFFAFLPFDDSSAFPTVLKVSLETPTEDNLYQPNSLKSIALCRLPCPKSKGGPSTGLHLVLKTNGKTHPPTRTELVKMSKDVSAVLNRAMLRNVYSHNQYGANGVSGNINSIISMMHFDVIFLCFLDNNGNF